MYMSLVGCMHVPRMPLASHDVISRYCQLPDSYVVGDQTLSLSVNGASANSHRRQEELPHYKEPYIQFVWVVVHVQASYGTVRRLIVILFLHRRVLGGRALVQI